MTILAALALGTAAFAPVDDHPRQPTGRGSVQVGQMNAPNKTHVEYTYELQPAGESWRTNGSMSCRNVCKGNKHLTHQQCDSSCDDDCRQIHKQTRKGQVDINTFRPQPMGADLVRALAQMGLQRGAINPNFPERTYERAYNDQVVSDALGQLGFTSPSAANGGNKDWWQEDSSDCWNDDPCSTVVRQFKDWQYDVVLKWKIVRYEGRTGRTAIEGTEYTATIGKAWVPQPNFTDANPHIECKCAVVDERLDNTDEGFYRSPVGMHALQMGIDIPRTGGVFFDSGGDGEYRFADDKATKEIGLSITVPNLNEYRIGVTSKLSNVRFMPGVYLVPDDDDYQAMVTMSQAMIAGLNASTHPLLDMFATGRAACLEINKKEPNERVRYDWRMPADPRLDVLGDYVARQRIRGPWDQARMWAYMDGASLDEINERLTPKVSASRYMIGLHEIHDLTGFDFADGKYDDCFDPALLAAGHNFTDVAAWFAGSVAERSPRDVERWIEDDGEGAFSTILQPGQPEWTADYAAAVVNQLCAAESEGVREATLEMVAELSPDRLARLADAGGLNIALRSLKGDDEGLADKALDVAEAANSPATYAALVDMNEDLPESLRDRAAELANRIAG